MRDMSNGARKSGASTDDAVASKVAKTVHDLEANAPETDEIRGTSDTASWVCSPIDGRGSSLDGNRVHGSSHRIAQ